MTKPTQEEPAAFASNTPESEKTIILIPISLPIPLVEMVEMSERYSEYIGNAFGIKPEDISIYAPPQIKSVVFVKFEVPISV